MLCTCTIKYEFQNINVFRLFDGNVTPNSQSVRFARFRLDSRSGLNT